MFRMIGLGENIGSGFPMILRAWGKENWRKPDIEENIDLRQVELKLWMISLMPEECLRSLKELYGKHFEKLNHDEQIILATAYLEGEVTNYRLQAIMDLHPTDIGKMLSGLVLENMLVAKGRARWTRYCVNYDFVIDNCQMTFEDMVNNTKFKFNKTDETIYQFIKENGFITTSQILQITRIKTLQGANVAVKRLEKGHLIRRACKGKTTYYVLV